MLGLAVLLLVQAADAGRALAGLDGLMADATKNADELERRYETLSKAIDAELDPRTRTAVLAYLPRLARKTGRFPEALAAAREWLKVPGMDPGLRDFAWREAVYTAALAGKPDEVVALVKSLAQERPDHYLASRREELEREARMLGRAAPAVALPAHEGARPFSWAAETKDKLVILYFTASW